jgi:subtilisin family serine protease
VKLFLALLLAAMSASTFAAPRHPIPGRWIVVFKDTVANPDDESDRMVRNFGGHRHHTFTRVLKGFAATLPDAAVERLRADPDVAYVEQDEIASIDATEDLSVQGSWGLDRIDQPTVAFDHQYNYNATGSGVWAFIIDTGIRADHTEFGGRVIAGFSSVSDGNGTNDCHGHGTHVSGTVGGATYGVAKQVTLVPVRVLKCDGTGPFSGIIAGLDWVAKQTTKRPAVANMSLGGSRSTSINAAVARAVASGVTVAVAAGNDNIDACQKSPASEPSAITVGATKDDDARASFSNFGQCVDIFAPGVGITSSWNTNASATNTISGTSMATPHVAGAAALVLSSYPSATPAAVANFLVSTATPGTVSDITGKSPNLMLFTLGAGVPAEPPPVYVAVRSLSGSALRGNRTTWKPHATIAVRNLASGDPVMGAIVHAAFAPGGTVQCTTGRRGDCDVSVTVPKTSPTSVFTVTGIDATGLVYDATQNSATQVTIQNTGR